MSLLVLLQEKHLLGSTTGNISYVSSISLRLPIEYSSLVHTTLMCSYD